MSEQVDLAQGVNSRTGKPYRYYHGWILRKGAAAQNIAQDVAERRGLRKAETAEEIKAGARKPFTPSPRQGRPSGPVRFRHGGGQDIAIGAAERRGLRQAENREIARAHAASVASRTRTNRLATRGFGDANARYSGNIGQVADKATAALRGKKASDYQHLAAARLHAAAAKYQSANAAERTHHAKLAAMHRGIATRTPGRGTRQRSTRPPAGRPSPPSPSRASPMKGASPAPPSSKGYGRLPGGKAATSTAGRQQLLKAGRALPPSKPGGRPGFPIGNAKNWDDALKAVGRAGSPSRREALRKLLLRTASSVGRSGAVKGSWLEASNTGLAIQLARQAYSRHPGEDVKCPFCGAYDMDDAKFCDQCGRKLPDSAFEHSNPMEFAMPTVQPVSTPSDLIVSRGEDGNVIIRHRNGGAEIGQLTRTEAGGWVATVGGKQLAPRNHQRTALADIIGTHNKGALTERHRPASAGEPLQPAPRQTPLMRAYGIDAIRALATPTTSASSGPRVTGNGGSDNDADDSSGGLNAKGQAIYKKLKARGFPEARAMAFARRAQNFGAGK